MQDLAENVYADRITITVRFTGDFRFPELTTNDGDQLTITLLETEWEWNPRELRQEVKQRILTPRSEPFRVSDTYVEVEAGASGAYWELLLELATGSLKDIALPALVGYLAGRIGLSRTSKIEDAASEVTDSDLERVARSTIAIRYGAGALEGMTIRTISWSVDGSAKVELELKDRRQFEIGIRIDANSSMNTVSMVRTNPDPEAGGYDQSAE